MCCPQLPSTLDTIADYSNIIVAIATLALGWYIFVYERRRDSHDRIDRELERRRNIRLEWFKAAIIQPNLDYIYDFYGDLFDIIKPLKQPGITLAEKSIILQEIKNHGADFRQKFIDLVGAVDESLRSRIQTRLDELVDVLTNNIFDEGINLSHPPVYNEKIEKPVNTSKSDLFKLLFSYEGLN